MRRTSTHALAASVMAIGLVASACSSSPSSNTATTKATTGTTSTAIAATTTTSQGAATTTTSGTNLQSLIPTPANTQRTDGPNSLQDNGTHMHFVVNGSPADVMSAYKTSLEGNGWSLTVESSGGGGRGGGATYTGTNGDAYGGLAEEAMAARPTSMLARGRQSLRPPNAVATAEDNDNSASLAPADVDCTGLSLSITPAISCRQGDSDRP